MVGGENMKKVRFTAPYFLKSKLLEDSEHFSLLIGEMGNRILKYYSNRELEDYHFEMKKGEIIQFNLNKWNEELYDTILQEHNVVNEAEFLRNMFFHYMNQPRYMREEILFFDIFAQIRLAMEDNKKIHIKYNGQIRTVSPYLIKVSPNEDRSYVFVYCETNNEFRNYRITNMESVSISIKERKEVDWNYVQEIERNFDPFLSYGNIVKVKMTPEGEALWKTALINRPKLVKQEKDIWTLECANRLAKIYFSQFLSKVEIIEPLSLRQWFIEEWKRGIAKYEGGYDE